MSIDVRLKRMHRRRHALFFRPHATLMKNPPLTSASGGF
jgi:hypothetical protein